MKRLIVFNNWFVCRFYEINGKPVESRQNVNATPSAMMKHASNAAKLMTKHAVTYAVRHLTFGIIEQWSLVLHGNLTVISR